MIAYLAIPTLLAALIVAAVLVTTSGPRPPDPPALVLTVTCAPKPAPPKFRQKNETQLAYAIRTRDTARSIRGSHGRRADAATTAVATRS